MTETHKEPGVLTLYLAHATEDRKNIREWELEFEGKQDKIALANPFYDNPFNAHDVAVRDSGVNPSEDLDYGERIVPRDLRFLRLQEGIVAVLDETWSVGRDDERVYARVFDMFPRCAICLDKRYFNHGFVRYHVTNGLDGRKHIYRTKEEFEDDAERLHEEWQVWLRAEPY